MAVLTTPNQGVEYFWWLGPEEPIAAEDGRMWPLGAFVYLYRDGDEDKDCFLALTHPSTPALPSPIRPAAAAALAGSPGFSSPADLRQRALAQLAKLKAEQVHYLVITRMRLAQARQAQGGAGIYLLPPTEYIDQHI